MHELNWRWDDWEKLAQGLTVGHLLEMSQEPRARMASRAAAEADSISTRRCSEAVTSVRGTATTRVLGDGGSVGPTYTRQSPVPEAEPVSKYVAVPVDCNWSES